MKIILISGKAEAGKTTAANIIKYYLCGIGKHAAIVPYGQYVKDTAKMIFGWDGQKDENGRQLLQWWGTDVVRKKNENFWVNTVMRLADVLDGEIDYLIIDDCRFPNEIDLWKDDINYWQLEWHEWSYLTLRIERPGHENALNDEQRKHPSETALDDYEFDVTISATDFKELKEAIYEQVLPIIV